jgi:hypothetical protein
LHNREYRSQKKISITQTGTERWRLVIHKNYINYLYKLKIKLIQTGPNCN